MGEPEVTKAAPTYHVDEGGIVTVGLRAPRTKGGFRMLKTKVAEILEGGRRFCRPWDRSFPVSTNLDRASGKVCETVYTGHALGVNNWCEVHPRKKDNNSG